MLPTSPSCAVHCKGRRVSKGNTSSTMWSEQGFFESHPLRPRWWCIPSLRAESSPQAAVELAAADGPTGLEGVGRLTWEVATAHFGRKATLMVALILAATVTMPTSPPVPCGSLPFYPFQGAYQNDSFFVPVPPSQNSVSQSERLLAVGI